MSNENRPDIAVLLTCHNRRDQTLRCLQSVFAQGGAETLFTLTVVLVDDGSTDGTAEAVRARFPAVHVIAGTGHLYWNRGMRVAFRWALARSFDFYLWINDHTQLRPAALSTLLSASHESAMQGTPAIITGSTCDPLSGRRTYGGLRWGRGWRRELIAAGPHATDLVPCDTMNGNCTLIPDRVAQVVGNLDSAFQHSFGDLDYGFRARTAGFPIYVAPDFLGECSDNSRAGTWRDRDASLRKRWTHLTSAKGSPPAEWALYCCRHLGVLWPLYALSPYVKTLVTSVPGRPNRAGAPS